MKIDDFVYNCKTLVSRPASRRPWEILLGGIVTLTVCLAFPTAGVTAACDAGKLKDYVKLGAGGCTYKDLMFTNFTYDGESDDTDAIAADGIAVMLDSLETGEYGLMFEANWNVTSNQSLASKIRYDVTVLNKKKLTGEILIINGGMINNGGFVDGSESTNNADLEVYNRKGDNQETDSKMFKGVASDEIAAEVDVSAGGFADASVQSESNIFVLDVPEPATWAMVMMGVAGVGAALRRTSRTTTRRRGSPI